MIRLSANIVKALPVNSSETLKPLMLVLFSSPRKNGSTSRLLSSFIKAVGNRYDIKIIDCYRLLPKPCIHCGECEKADVCIFDDLEEYNRLLIRAEVLVFASPVYNLSVPSPLKALIDRSQRYFSKCFSLGIKPPLKTHKRAVLLLSCGSGDKTGFDIIERQLGRMFTVMNTELFGKVCQPNTDKIKENPQYEAKAYDLGKKI